MNPTDNTRYPRGGDTLWTDGSVASGVFNIEFFGVDEPAGVVANVTGAQAAAQAGTLTARGAGDAALTGAQAASQVGAPIGRGAGRSSAVGVQAESQAGTLTAVGAASATATVAGVQASALAGIVTAREGGVTPEPAPPRFGGGSKKRRMRESLPAYADVVIPHQPVLSVPAVATVSGAGASSAAGTVRAAGTISAKASIGGATSRAVCEPAVALGGVRVKIGSVVIGAHKASAALRSVPAVASCGVVGAKGLGFTDAELLALVGFLEAA